MEYFTDKEFRSNEGAVVILRLVMDTEDPSVSKELFIGKGGFMIQTPMGNMPHEVEVPLEVESVQEAFQTFDEQMNEKFHDYAQAEVEKLQEQARQQQEEARSQIVTPDQLPKFNG
jgi:hypothetical protein